MPDPKAMDELEEFRRYRSSGDRSLRNRLVERHQGFAYYLAKSYAGRGLDLDDLRQVAVIGLVKAVERFDPDRGAAFATFARPFVVGELRHHFRDKSWELCVPRSLKEDSQRVRSAIETLRSRVGREPRVADVAEEAGLGVDDVLAAMEAMRTTRTRRFEASPAGAAPLEQLHPRVDESGFQRVENRAVLAGLLDDLGERERFIVHARFVEERSQSDIADEVGISQVHVSRLLRQSLTSMGQRLEDAQLSEA
jgi:RNA polymerase sigma-B factor